MAAAQIDVVLRRFDNPDERRVIEKGRFDIVQIGGVTIGRAAYEPGWKWPEHVGPTATLASAGGCWPN